jgi:pre-rRNA-processing protein IPI3
MYDVLQAQVCLRVSLPQPLESLACNPTQDLICAGSSNGSIFLIDLTSTAIALTAAHAHVSHHHTIAPSANGVVLPHGTSVLEGHTKTVTSVCFARDNCTLVSASTDGSVRIWNAWTRQCLREFYPLSKHAISNALVKYLLFYCFRPFYSHFFPPDTFSFTVGPDTRGT